MNDETRDGTPLTVTPPAKRPWIAPRLEVARGRDASTNFRNSGTDYGYYS